MSIMTTSSWLEASQVVTNQPIPWAEGRRGPRVRPVLKVVFYMVLPFAANMRSSLGTFTVHISKPQIERLDECRLC